MPASHPVDELVALSRRFGAEAAAAKLALLERMAAHTRLSARQLSRLHDALYFMRAYPDDARVLQSVVALTTSLRQRVERLRGDEPYVHALLDSGLPGSCNAYPYSYAVLVRLCQLQPGAFEIDWEQVDDDAALNDALMLLVSPSEVQALEDQRLSLREWLEASRGGADETDLEVVLSLFERSSLGERERVNIYERCQLPIVYHLRAVGSGRGEIHLPAPRPRYQKRDVPRERFDVRPRIRRPLPPGKRLSPAEGRRLLDVALMALASRNLEIYPLMYGDPEDVTLVDVGRGLAVMLSGVRPELRSPLEAVFFFSVLKNGVPIAYGPASSFLGACEMGINLFPEFRGGEIRYLYAQLMRVLYHLAHVRYFFLTPYGMGEDNDDALKSGAFWFYRKLGFSAERAEVEALARSEEAIMARTPGHRSSLATLRKLSHTAAYLDLSGGHVRPFPFGALGLAATRLIARDFGGDRGRATAACTRRLRRWLELDDLRSWSASERGALEAMAPTLCLLPDLPSWSRADRRSLTAILRAKGGHSEAGYAARVLAHPRLGVELRALAEADTSPPR